MYRGEERERGGEREEKGIIDGGRGLFFCWVGDERWRKKKGLGLRGGERRRKRGEKREERREKREERREGKAREGKGMVGKGRDGNFGMSLLLSMGVVKGDEDTVGSCGYIHSVVSMPEGAYVCVWVCLPNLGILIRQPVILDEEEKGNVFE